jgi:hypothetical protein
MNRGVRQIRGKEIAKVFPVSFRVFRVFRGCPYRYGCGLAALRSLWFNWPSPVSHVPTSKFHLKLVFISVYADFFLATFRPIRVHPCPSVVKNSSQPWALCRNPFGIHFWNFRTALGLVSMGVHVTNYSLGKPPMDANRRE